MQKGAFNGKKLSDLKPKSEAEIIPTVEDSSIVQAANQTGTNETPLEPISNETAIQNQPRSSANVSPAVLEKEAQNRLDRVVKEVLEVRSYNDHQKERFAYDFLNRGPKKVRVAILEQMAAFMVSLESVDHQTRLKKVRRLLTNEHPLENVSVSLDAFFEKIDSEIFSQTRPQGFASDIIGEILNLHPDLYQHLVQRLPEVIESHRTTWRAQEYQNALSQLEQFEQVRQHLAALHQQGISPEEKAEVFVEGFTYQMNHTDGENIYLGAFFNIARRTIKEAPAELLSAYSTVLFKHLMQGHKYSNYLSTFLFDRLYRPDELADSEKQTMLEYLGRLDDIQISKHWQDYDAKRRLLSLIDELLERPSNITAFLRRASMQHMTYMADELKAIVKAVPFGVNMGEAWSDLALADLETMPQTERDTWEAFLKHANTDKAKPSTAWETKAKKHISSLSDFTTRVTTWLSFVGKPRTHTLLEDNEKFDPWNANIVRGLAWALALTEATDDTARGLANLVETSLKKVPGVGPRNPKLATAGTVALGRLNSSFAVGQLARLKARVTFKTTLKEIEKALEESANRAGISKEDLEEIAVPTFGLEANGRRVEELGNYRAELRLENNDVILEFFEANKKLKAAPASLKTEFAEDLKDLKAAQKDIAGMIGAIKVRIEKLHLSKKTWTFAQWRERYLEHPLVAQITKRLIWIVDGSSVAIHPERGIEGVNGEKLEFSDSASVSLWHPIQVPTAEVLAWRDWLEQAGIVQPWKQAHREVYVLTAAEERTRTYSNRFAAHIIKQHQFAQLAASRGWNNELRLMIHDCHSPASLELPEWGLRAEYWVEGIGDNYGVDTTESGTYLRLITDQLRFYTIGAAPNHAHAGGGGYGPSYQFPIPAEPIPLEQVPVIVLSEVMRDVDLFVGVSSVGNDPTWQDGGPNGTHRDYWQNYSFGDLNATAVTRKEILERLVPRLKIKDRASLDGKFLKVRGEIRSYKIHLGSGNILMEPNDQYLCIVPNSSMDSTNVSLPFEGDRMLAVILSKAFLLAEDKKITDVTITRQIKFNQNIQQS